MLTIKTKIRYNMQKSGDKMKKKITIILILLIAILSGFFFCNSNKKKAIIKPKITIKEENKKEKEQINYQQIITELQKKYNNNDIVALVKIPDLLEEEIVQTKDNDYYLHYDKYKNKNIIGATFLDYRNNIETSQKLLIYSHSDPDGTLPFVKLTNYNNQDFYTEHKYIYLIDSKKERKYEVFASYIETDDFDYVNLNDFNGLTYEEHLNKLKNRSVIKTDVELAENSKVLILQTCSFNKDINAKDKYQLVMAKEIEAA